MQNLSGLDGQAGVLVAQTSSGLAPWPGHAPGSRSATPRKTRT